MQMFWSALSKLDPPHTPHSCCTATSTPAHMAQGSVLPARLTLQWHTHENRWRLLSITTPVCLQCRLGVSLDALRLRRTESTYARLLLCNASLLSFVGRSTVTIDVDTTVASLWQELIKVFPLAESVPNAFLHCYGTTHHKVCSRIVMLTIIRFSMIRVLLLLGTMCCFCDCYILLMKSTINLLLLKIYVCDRKTWALFILIIST
jgi:hypothetical protein